MFLAATKTIPDVPITKRVILTESQILHTFSHNVRLRMCASSCCISETSSGTVPNGPGAVCILQRNTHSDRIVEVLISLNVSFHNTSSKSQHFSCMLPGWGGGSSMVVHHAFQTNIVVQVYHIIYVVMHSCNTVSHNMLSCTHAILYHIICCHALMWYCIT